MQNCIVERKGVLIGGVLIPGVSLERGAPRITKYDGTYIGIPSITDVWGYDREFCIYASESQWHR